MRRIFMIVLAAVCLPVNAHADPREEGQAALEKFLASYTSADARGVSSLFAPDVLFWGTRARDLITGSDGVHAYFTNAFGTPGRPAGEVKASAVGAPSISVLSDDAVAVSGMWRTETVKDGKGVPGGDLRFAMTVIKRGDRWLIGSFHNSPRQPAP